MQRCANLPINKNAFIGKRAFFFLRSFNINKNTFKTNRQIDKYIHTCPNKL